MQAGKHYKTIAERHGFAKANNRYYTSHYQWQDTQQNYYILQGTVRDLREQLEEADKRLW
jgi:hypothetical protein